MIDNEARLERATVKLEASRRYGLSEQHRKLALVRAEMRGLTLTSEQRSAFDHVTSGRGLSVVVGYAGTGKSAMLGVAREAWESAGYRVQGLALSGIAAENLEGGSGIASRTIASLEHQWGQGRDLLTDKSILVIDEAGMIGTRQLERVIAEAERRGAKVVLVGDPEQLQAIEAGAAFRSVAERHGSIEITDIRRQREDWQRMATRQLATERTEEALGAYQQHDAIHVAETREGARVDLIDRWDRQRQAEPDASRIILTYTNDEVALLNQAARSRLRAREELGDDVTLQVERGERHFAPATWCMRWRRRGLIAMPPMLRCPGTVTVSISTMAATTLPIMIALPPRCRASGARTWRPITRLRTNRPSLRRQSHATGLPVLGSPGQQAANLSDLRSTKRSRRWAEQLPTSCGAVVRASSRSPTSRPLSIRRSRC